MGVKEVLYRTRNFGWGMDTHLYCSAAEFRDLFPGRLAQSGPRVLKQNRGNDGQGVWKVELIDGEPDKARVLYALRGSVPEELPFTAFIKSLRELFRLGRMHHRSAIPASTVGGHVPLLHGR